MERWYRNGRISRGFQEVEVEGAREVEEEARTSADVEASVHHRLLAVEGE